MDYVVITLRYQDGEADLELPVGVPLFNLLPIVANVLSWPIEGDAAQIVGRVQRTGRIIQPHSTLAQWDVSSGDVIDLMPKRGDLVEPNIEPAAAAVPAPAGGKTYLQALATGEVFPFKGRAILIGRRSREMRPDVDLDAQPNSDAVSRRHARLVQRPDGYWIYDENSTNGTIVDGFRLPQKGNARLAHGSQIQFGDTGPILVFYSDADSKA